MTYGAWKQAFKRSNHGNTNTMPYQKVTEACLDVTLGIKIMKTEGFLMQNEGKRKELAAIITGRIVSLKNNEMANAT